MSSPKVIAYSQARLPFDSNMSLTTGQLLLLEASNAQWNSRLERLLEHVKPAGVLFNGLTSIPAMREMAHKCTSVLGSVPFLAVRDEDDGALSRLFGSSLPRAYLTGVPGEAIEALGGLVGRAMEIAGLNLNLAPSVDLPAALSGAASRGGDASQSASNPLEVTHRADAFVRGITRHGVLSCAGHFPGLTIGAGKQPPGSPVVGRSMAMLWREDLVPYRKLGDKLPLVQISHAVYKAYDYEFPRPASLSPSIVKGLLRLKLGYHGVAVADIAPAACSAGIEINEAAVRTLEAGCDLLIVPAEEKPLAAVLEALRRATDFGRLSPARVEQALARIGNVKQAVTRLRGEPGEREVSRLMHDFERLWKQHGHAD